MLDLIVPAATAPQVPVTAPVIDGKGDAQAPPSAEAKPELIDFSPLGDSYKDFKVDKRIAEKLPELLKNMTPEEVETLTDAQVRKLYFQSEKGYRAAHNERFEKEHKAIQAAEAKGKELTEREEKILERESELAEDEGNAYFYRDPKVKAKVEYANEKVEERKWTPEEAEEFVKPYMDTAKQAYKDRKTENEKQLKALMDGNAKIGKETFPEFDPMLASQIVDGFTIHGSDPQSGAQLFRKELDRVLEYTKVKAVADYVKELNGKQPDTPGVEQAKMIPNKGTNTTRDDEIALGRGLLGFFGKK